MGNDPFDLDRFVQAQARTYARAIDELEGGEKTTHWMWFVFPQFAGLGRSDMAQRYAIGSLDEARAYLAHPLLGPRLLECCETLLRLQGLSASDIFGWPDDMKLRSSMTLFAQAASSAGSPFVRVLDRFFAGAPDDETLRLVQ